MNKPVRKVKAGGPPPTELPIQPTQEQLDRWKKDDEREELLALAAVILAIVMATMAVLHVGALL